MAYYFPFGGSQAITAQNISHSLSATTASVPFNSTVMAATASFAMTSGSVPPAGIGGISVTEFACNEAAQINPKLLTSGSTGLQGPTGSKGTDNLTCPQGTIECTALAVFLPNLNTLRPSGSQFSKVCMEIPPGCTNITATCPPYLPSASVTTTYPSIP